MNDKLQMINQRLRALTVFKKLVEDSVIKELMEFLSIVDICEDKAWLIDGYTALVHELYAKGGNLTKHVLDLVTNDENVYVKKCALGEEVSSVIYDATMAELEILSELAVFSSVELKSAIDYDGFLPDWETSDIDIKKEYIERIRNISKFGYGIYSKYHMFYVKESKIVPVKHPDKISMNDLIGYRDERQQIIDNTRALVEGRPAANALLFGDAGTGKSSTVKAVANAFKDEGLRIVEIRKEQLWEIPEITDELNSIPLKFILFIDDLSFNKGDDNYSSLKAILEGSVSARSKNVVIYATSNRRHLIKESFSDREGDDIHRNDTMQETVSLSERFGLRVTFGKPDKKCYLDIVKRLAEKEEINMDEKKLEMLAERFALEKSGRSARGARQFIDSLLANNLTF